MEKRHENCREILEGARVGDKALDVVCQTEHTFWMGDLNYRINHPEFRPAPAQIYSKST